MVLPSIIPTLQYEASGNIGPTGPTGPVAVTTGNIITTGSSYSMQVTDLCLIINKSTGSATAIALPTGMATYTNYIIKDGKGDAATNNITISGATIDGQSSITINQNYGHVNLLWNGSSWNVI